MADLSSGQRQAITNAGMLLIGLLRTNFNEILIKIQTFSEFHLRKYLKMSSVKCWPFGLSLNALTDKANILTISSIYDNVNVHTLHAGNIT